MREPSGRSAVQGALVLVLALVLPFAASAENDGTIRGHIISINRLYEDLEYELALGQVKLARQLPRSTDDEVTLSLYEGIILCEMGKQDLGASLFRAALLLRPGAKLPVQVAPKVDALFESVRTQVKQEAAFILPPSGTEKTSDKSEQLETKQREEERLGAERVLIKKKLLDAANLDTSKCQPAVSTDCERQLLMQRLRTVQKIFLSTKPSSTLPPIRELVTIGNAIRAARTHEDLQQASQAIDAWQQRHLTQ